MKVDGRILKLHVLIPCVAVWFIGSLVLMHLSVEATPPGQPEPNGWEFFWGVHWIVWAIGGAIFQAVSLFGGHRDAEWPFWEWDR